jgi:thiamine-monophosphate kinase
MSTPLTPEDQLTNWLRRRVARHGVDLLGDDAAFLPRAEFAVTVDQQVAGVHFPAGLPAATIGRRLVAVNLSDIAAIGGRPAYGFLTVAAPPGLSTKPLLAAVEEELARHGARLAGGDLARSKELSTSLTLFGTRTPHGRWVRRDTGHPEDRLWIGGTVGESALGRLLLDAGANFESGRVLLAAEHQAEARTAAVARRAVRRHLCPHAQLELGEWLARRRRAAAIDISDGLLLDLERLCRASGVGATVNANRLPVVRGFATASKMMGTNAVDLALTGGEDYVLLFALPPRIHPPEGLGVTEIGTLRAGEGIEIVGSEPPDRHGWDHFSSY